MSAAPAVSIREGYIPGCIGRVTEMHAQFYARHADFGLYFENKVARELAEFCERYVEGRDGLWLAMAGGRIGGSVAVDGVDVAAEGVGGSGAQT